jgi:hypothetical protein
LRLAARLERRRAYLIATPLVLFGGLSSPVRSASPSLVARAVCVEQWQTLFLSRKRPWKTPMELPSLSTGVWVGSLDASCGITKALPYPPKKMKIFLDIL